MPPVVIKPYVMLAVYEQIARQELNETPDISRQVYRMITVSDNQATNTLIRHLGQGDNQQGIVVSQRPGPQIRVPADGSQGTHPGRREDVCQPDFRRGYHLIF